ncbi:MAG: DUF4430 domain-containing protein [Patescibacteria group bacterium]
MDKNKNNKKIIWLGLAISLFFFLIFIFTKDIGQNANSASPPLSILDSSPTPRVGENAKDKAFLEIDGKILETTIVEEENVYDFMVKLKEERKIDFKDKTYSGMGKLIEKINGIKNSGEKNWIYYVNNKKANIGVSNYKLNSGDVVSWKYEKNN